MNRLLELMNATEDVDEQIEAYEEYRKTAELERRAKFSVFDVDPEDVCPATSVFHAHSSLQHDTPRPMSDEDVRPFTTNLDYKTYPDARRVELPGNPAHIQYGLAETARRRRSTAEFADAPLSLEQLATIFAVGCGVTDPDSRPPKRATPSPGALYPIETYVLAFRVQGLPVGLYHYDVLGHSLEVVRPVQGPKDLWPVLCHDLWGVEPAVAMMLTARLPRVQPKYGERGYRFALLECGHIGQSLLMTAVAMGLTSLPVGGYIDAEFTRLLGIDGIREVGLYIALIGNPKSGDPQSDGNPQSNNP